MYILGISCFYHDAAACLLKDGELIAAVQEERFTRIKHDYSFPIHSINYCLKQAGIAVKNLDYIGFYEKPLLKFERILYSYLATFPRSFRAFLKAMPVWLREKLWIGNLISKRLGYEGEILFCEHHLSHAASAFLVSPFKEAAILTIDGVGEWATATYGVGKGNEISLFKEIRYPHSLGLLYSAFTYHLGFRVNSAEYKVMGLAPYGEPKYVDLIKRELIAIKEDGSFQMNMAYFAYPYGLTMTNGKFDRLFGVGPRKPESALEQVHKDLAASIQKVTEEVMVKMAQNLFRETGLTNLCLAGGVALNCVGNGQILRGTPFKNIFIQPAASDAGGALGVAEFIYHNLLKNERRFVLAHAFWGPDYSDAEIEQYLRSQNVLFRCYKREELLKEVASLIEQQKVIGWFQGRMEFGPRALGNRSIIADARNPENRDIVNLKIKFRESFRPFAPSVLADKAKEYFELDCLSPYMLLTAQVRADKRTIPAVTHVDGSARIQTVNREENALFYDLIKVFYELTGCPVIINTSFNVRGEPIVCTPEEAFGCFINTDMDYLVIGSFVLDKQQMPADLKQKDWHKQYEKD